LIPAPGLGHLPAFLVAPSNRHGDWTTPESESDGRRTAPGESRGWTRFAALCDSQPGGSHLRSKMTRLRLSACRS
jgi:hypothetical protein